MSAPKNIQELGDELMEQFELVKKDPKRVFQAQTMANIAGKRISALALEFQYSLARGEEPDIPFMGKTSGQLLKPTAKLIKG